MGVGKGDTMTIAENIANKFGNDERCFIETKNGTSIIDTCMDECRDHGGETEKWVNSQWVFIFSDCSSITVGTLTWRIGE
jgi:hypothetical protein